MRTVNYIRQARSPLWRTLRNGFLIVLRQLSYNICNIIRHELKLQNFPLSDVAEDSQKVPGSSAELVLVFDLSREQRVAPTAGAAAMEFFHCLLFFSMKNIPRRDDVHHIAS